MSHIFLSYSTKDKAMVDKIAQDLENEGFKIWQNKEMNFGENWSNQIEQAINTADAVLAFISSNSRTSKWFRAETGKSLIDGKFIIPILLERVDVPLYLGELYRVDFTDPNLYNKRIKDVIEALSYYIKKLQSSQTLRLANNDTQHKSEKIKAEEIVKKEFAKEVAALMADEMAKMLGIEKETRLPKPRIDERLIFVIISFENDMNPVFEGIKAAGNSLGLEVKRVKDVIGDYRITEQIINMMNSARFIVADLTHERPNVYFELGYARGLGKTVITTAREGTNIHFDVKDWAYISYTDSRILEQDIKKRFEYELSKTQSP